jgi:hypothetical protein
VTNLIRLATILLLLSLAAAAQDLAEAPSTYWTKTNIGLIAADAAAKSVDMAFTMRNYGLPGFEEHDPLARPFVHSGPVLAGVAQGLLFATEVFTSYELHRHGHRKMEKVVLMLGIGGNTAGIATSTR